MINIFVELSYIQSTIIIAGLIAIAGFCAIIQPTVNYTRSLPPQPVRWEASPGSMMLFARERKQKNPLPLPSPVPSWSNSAAALDGMMAAERSLSRPRSRYPAARRTPGTLIPPTLSRVINNGY